MNDRFKFRAKRLDNNNFVYGYLCFIYIDNEKHCKIYSPDDAMSYDCYTETLGQCTSLKDKNGKLIYEGDIVEVGGRYAKGNYKIIFDECDCEYDLKSGNGWFVYQLDSEIADNSEVIGNIHDNADLLGEDK